MLNTDNIILQMAIERKKEKTDSIEDQRRLLEYASRAIPTLESVKLTSPGKMLYDEKTTEFTNNILGGIVFAVDKLLGSTNFDNTENGWNYLEIGVLLDALTAVNFYTNVAVNCPNIAPVRDRLLNFLKTKIDQQEIDKRLTEMISKTVEYINTKEKLFVAYNTNMDENIPLISGEGYAWVFTEREYADNIVNNNSNVPIGIKEYSLTEFKKYLSTWVKYNLEEFTLNVGTNDNNVEVPVNSLCESQNEKLLGASVNYIMIRCQQCRGVVGAENIFAALWGYATKLLKHSVYLIPMCYEDDQGPIEDYNIHTTQRAASILLKMQLKKQLDTSLENYVVEVDTEKLVNNPLVGQTFDGYTDNPVPFYGAQKYRFATAKGDNAVQIGKKMCLRTLINNGQNFIPLFTDMETLHLIYGEKVRVGIFTWDDVCERLNDGVKNLDGSIGDISGVVFNPGLVNFVFSLLDVDNINNAKNKP